MTGNDKPARKPTWPNCRPTKSRYNMPETLGILRWYKCTQTDLGQYLFDGELRAVGWPYRHDPDRAVDFVPWDFKRIWKDPSGFPIYDNYIGDMYRGDEPDSGRHTMPQMPMHMVPSAVDEDTKILDEDRKPMATSALVYVPARGP